MTSEDREIHRSAPARPSPAVPASLVDGVDADPTPVGQRLVVKRSATQRLLMIGAIVFALAVAYYLVTLWQVWGTGRSDDARPADAIIVMGAAQYDGRPSPQLAARLDHAADLWKTDAAPLIVVTGGNRPGDRYTEAEASASFLIGLGIPAVSILGEDEGSSSYESMEAVARLLLAQGLDEVVIVTDPYHALRSRMIAADLGLDAAVSSTPTSVVTGASSLQRHVTEAAAVSIGRIVGFDRLDDLTD